MLIIFDVQQVSNIKKENTTTVLYYSHLLVLYHSACSSQDTCIMILTTAVDTAFFCQYNNRYAAFASESSSPLILAFESNYIYSLFSAFGEMCRRKHAFTLRYVLLALICCSFESERKIIQYGRRIVLFHSIPFTTILPILHSFSPQANPTYLYCKSTAQHSTERSTVQYNNEAA